VTSHEALPRLPKPQSLRKGWALHEAKGQQASDEANGKGRQKGLLIDL
jgi:hypothetical protein